MLYLALTIFLLFIFLTYKKPLWALFLLSAILPSYLLRLSIYKLPSTILEFAIWGMTIGYLLSLRAHSNSEWRGNLINLWQRLSLIKYPLALFFLASIIAIFVAPDKLSALGLWRAYFLESILVLFLILAIIREDKNFSYIIFGLSISAFYIFLYALGQKFFGLPIPIPWQAELRATSIFHYPNAVALYLAPIIILFLGQIKNIKNKLSATYYLLLTIFSTLAIVFAKSDAGLIAIIIGIFIFILLNIFKNKKYKAGIIIIILIFLAAGLLFLQLQTVQEKILLQDWSGFVRQTIWGETWAMLRDNPIFGVGLGGYQTAILPYHLSYEWMEVFLYPHNIIFNFWSELGLLGLVAFLWLLEKFGRMCYKSINTPLLSNHLFIITAISAMSVILIHGLVDVPYFKNDLSILFWIIFSMPTIGFPKPNLV